MKKIDASKWVESFEVGHSYYVAKPSFFTRVSSVPGRSTALTDCGFCGEVHEVFINSFYGVGKKCENCGATMYPGVTKADKTKVVNLKQQENENNVQLP